MMSRFEIENPTGLYGQGSQNRVRDTESQTRFSNGQKMVKIDVILVHSLRTATDRSAASSLYGRQRIEARPVRCICL